MRHIEMPPNDPATDKPFEGQTDGHGRNTMAKAVIEINPETGRRRILIDGEVFPYYTRGAIEVKGLRRGAYKEGGFWPASPEDEWIEDASPVYAHEVTVTLFIGGGVEWEDEALVPHTSSTEAAPDAENGDVIDTHDSTVDSDDADVVPIGEQQ